MECAKLLLWLPFGYRSLAVGSLQREELGVLLGHSPVGLAGFELVERLTGSQEVRGFESPRLHLTSIFEGSWLRAAPKNTTAKQGFTTRHRGHLPLRRLFGRHRGERAPANSQGIPVGVSWPASKPNLVYKSKRPPSSAPRDSQVRFETSGGQSFQATWKLCGPPKVMTVKTVSNAVQRCLRHPRNTSIISK
jgi:hypothetical protein